MLKKTRVVLTAVLARPWVDFNKVLMKLNEAEVSALLEQEKTGQRRLTFVLRLHARLNRLRRERERRELAHL